MFLQVKFKCCNELCPCHEWTPVTVLSRDRDQDIKEWMNYVVREVAIRHSTVAPKCDDRRCDLAIPLGSEQRGTQAPYVGAPTPDDERFQPDSTGD